MSETVRLRFWVEAAAAVMFAAALGLTLLWHDWIERLFGFEPDGGDGSFERVIVAALAVAAVASSVLARREWRRAAHAAG
jgi:hypothetical protein